MLALGKQMSTEPWDLLASHPHLICEAQVPARDPVSTKWMAPEEGHLRLTSGLYVYMHTCASSQVYASAHTQARIYTQKIEKKTIKLWTRRRKMFLLA